MPATSERLGHCPTKPFRRPLRPRSTANCNRAVELAPWARCPRRLGIRRQPTGESLETIPKPCAAARLHRRRDAARPRHAADISGAGATFPYPIYAKWADAYKKETGIGLNYQSIGSGGGIKQIKAKTVTFGATDAPLTGEDLDKDGLVQFPMVMGGIVPVVNLDGIEAGRARDRRPDARQDLPRRDQDLERPGDQEAQPERQAAQPGDRRRASLGRIGHDLQLHRLSRRR